MYTGRLKLQEICHFHKIVALTIVGIFFTNDLNTVAVFEVVGNVDNDEIGIF